MGYAADVKALTADISRLTAEIEKMNSVVALTGRSATNIFASVRASLGGGQKNLGSTGGNRMQSSLGNVPSTQTPTSMDGGGQGGKGTTGNGGSKVPNGGGANFSMYGQMGKVGLASSAIQAAGTVVSTMYNMAPDSSGVVNRAGSYYQAALRAPGMGRAGLAQATFSALRGGITGVGSDANVANILANAGYVPKSQDYLSAVRQVGGAARYLGMQNENAASAIAGLQGGPMSANLYQYGITTMNMNGSAKSTGEIAKQLYKVMFPNGATAKSVQESIRSGYAGLNLQGMGMSSDMQQIMSQAFTDIAAGKNPDLALAKSGAGNQNPFDPLFRMNTSSTMIQQASEKNTISGLGAAAGTIETFNNSMKDVIASMALFKGYLDGLSGNPQGAALKKGGVDLFKIGKKALGFGMMAVGAGLTPFTGGTSIPLIAGGAAIALGGGTPGYGSSFGGRNMGSGRYANGLITAGYGARDAQGGNWDSTGGVHQGTDYNVKVGTSVVATKDGIVSNATLSADYGQAIIIDHEDGFSTVYAHLSNKQVSPGTRVLQGQEIGKSGKSGNASGPHLHYEVWKGPNNPVDPSELKGASFPVSGSGITESLGISGGNPLAGIGTSSGILAGIATAGSATSGIATSTGMDYQGKIPPNADINLLETLKKAGFSGQGLATAYAVARAESGGRSNAYNPPSNGTGDDSYGIFQINMIGGLGPERLAKTWRDASGSTFKLSGKEDLFDPLTNAKVAYHMSNGGKNWSAWTTYTSGKYQQFLDPKGGGTPGSPGLSPQSYATATPATLTGAEPSRGDAKVVNFHVHLTDVSDAQALVWAKKIEAHLNNRQEVSLMGGK